MPTSSSVVTRRYDAQKAILLSTNKAFSQWSEVFPHAACVVTLVDRLTIRIVTGDGLGRRAAQPRRRVFGERQDDNGARRARAFRHRAGVDEDVMGSVRTLARSQSRMRSRRLLIEAEGKVCNH